jgi:hypothetical protein
MLQASSNEFKVQLVHSDSVEHSLFPPQSAKKVADKPSNNKRLLEQLEMRDLLAKWGLQSVKYHHFTFDAHYHPYRVPYTISLRYMYILQLKYRPRNCLKV